MKLKVCVLVIALLAGFGSIASADAVDIKEFPTGYFVNEQANTYNDPYYRWWDQDWGWQHGALGSFTTATLNISAWDVDYDYGERDAVSVLNISTNTWDFLGYLAGNNDAWGYSNFDVSAYSVEIAAGLKVWIDIDTTHNYDNWAVTLAKSVLSTDGGQLPDPDPNPTVPDAGSTASMLLLATGLLGFARMNRK